MYGHPRDLERFWLKVQLEGTIIDQFEAKSRNKGYYEMPTGRRYVVDRKERGSLYRDDNGSGWQAEKEAIENYADVIEDISLDDIADEIEAMNADLEDRESDSPLDIRAKALVSKVANGEITEPETVADVGQGNGLSLTAIIARAIELDPENWPTYSKIGSSLWTPVSNAEIVLAPETTYEIVFKMGAKVEADGRKIKAILDDELPDYWIEGADIFADYGVPRNDPVPMTDYRKVPVAHIRAIGPMVKITSTIRRDQWEKVKRHPDINLSGFIQEKLDELMEP
jgi:hypothetical protein